MEQQLRSTISHREEELASQRNAIQELQAELAGKGKQLESKTAENSMLAANCDAVQAAVAELEARFGQHREEADSSIADLHARLKASHQQVCMATADCMRVAVWSGHCHVEPVA